MSLCFFFLFIFYFFFSLYFPSPCINKPQNKINGLLSTMVLIPMSNINQDTLFEVLKSIQVTKLTSLWESYWVSQNLGIFFLQALRMAEFPLVLSLWFGLTGMLWVFWVPCQGTGAFSRINSSEELGLLAFSLGSFPQEGFSFFHLFFDSDLLPWAFPGVLGSAAIGVFPGLGGLSLLPEAAGTRTLLGLLSCGSFLYLGFMQWSFLQCCSGISSSEEIFLCFGQGAHPTGLLLVQGSWAKSAGFEIFHLWLVGWPFPGLL